MKLLDIILEAAQGSTPPAQKPAPVKPATVKHKKTDVLLEPAGLGAHIESAAKADGIIGVHLANFMAQCKVETAGFKSLLEWGTGEQYEGRKDLGNIYKGDGVRFKGRGFIHLTGRENYERCNKDCGWLNTKSDIVKNPELVETNLNIAIASTLWYWNLFIRRNYKATSIVGVSTRVNGTNPNGLNARIKAFKEYCAKLGIKIKGVDVQKTNPLKMKRAEVEPGMDPMATQVAVNDTDDSEFVQTDLAEGWFDSKPKVDWNKRAKELFAKGLNEQQVAEQLLKEGCPPNQVKVYVQAGQLEEQFCPDCGGSLAEHGKASRALCTSGRPDADLGASNLASCKSQGLRARDGEKSHLIGHGNSKVRVTVGGKKIKGKKYGGPLPDYGTRKGQIEEGAIDDTSEDASSPLFAKKVKWMASRLGFKPSDLYRVMHIETNGTMDPSVTNQIGCVGLIQFCPVAAQALNVSLADLGKMSAVKQLDYVYKFYVINRLKPGASVDDLYLMTLYPAAVQLELPDTTVIGEKNSSKSLYGVSLGKFWSQNPLFQNKSGKITVGDIRKSILDIRH